MEKKFRTKNFILIAGTILLSLALFSCWMVSNMYAKYTSSVGIGDSARVAKFEVTSTGWLTEPLDTVATIAPGEKFEKTIEVSNSSEVKVSYILKAIRDYESLPLTVTLKDSSGNIINDGEGKGEMEAGSTEKIKYTIVVEWPVTSEDARNASYEGRLDCITVVLRTFQMD